MHYFVRVWEGSKNTRTLNFHSLADAWKHIINERIEQYSVYEGDCVIDNSGEI